MVNEVGRVRCRRILDRTHYNTRPMLPSAMTHFQLFLVVALATPLTYQSRDLQIDDTEATGGLSNLIENPRHNIREEVFYGSPPNFSLTKSPVSKPAPGRIS